ncbi:transketolase C-terminal domain-containing protein [Achromobacter sp. Marseille-Q4962]|uniref:transketolase family protein n=1 Tax=Achromobacter sp. Marseille-Q4962 TaxID=2942202 RepID=UPI002073136E|nr:transketolase C-terminal domain-containing protein [Achromobacter sp. Marseille-Q4962]
MSSPMLTVNDFTDRSGNAATPKPYGQALLEAARRDPRIVALTADLSGPTETDLIRDALPAQFFQAGIAEANMVGMAGGMARCGCIPFVHTFSVFATRRAYDQVAMQLAYPNLNAKLVGFIPGLDTLLGVSHQAIDDIALMRALPNMRIIEPAPGQTAQAVAEALAHEGPVYLRLARAGGGAGKAGIPAANGLARLRAGRDGLLLACGLSVPAAQAAAGQLQERGLDVGVIAVTRLKPLPEELLAHVLEAGTVLTIENHSVIGGLGAAVAEAIAESGRAVRFKRIGVPDRFAYGASTPYLMREFGLDAPAVVEAFLALKASSAGGRADA